MISHYPSLDEKDALELARGEVGLGAGVMVGVAILLRHVRLGYDAPHTLHGVDKENEDKATSEVSTNCYGEGEACLHEGNLEAIGDFGDDEVG